MANLSITATNVIPASGYSYQDGIAGATIAAGETVYLDSATDTFKLADSNGTAAASAVRGIALHSVVSGQPIRVVTGGTVAIGAVMTAGVSYYQSATAGKLCPYADLTTNDRVVHVGYAATTGNLVLRIFETGVTL